MIWGRLDLGQLPLRSAKLGREAIEFSVDGRPCGRVETLHMPELMQIIARVVDDVDRGYGSVAAIIADPSFSPFLDEKVDDCQ